MVLGLVLLVALFPRPGLSDDVLVLLSSDQPHYLAVLDSLRGSLTLADDSRLRVMSAAAGAALPGTDLVVAIGSRATDHALSSYQDQAILSLLVPQSTLQALEDRHQAHGNRLSAVYLDQPMLRQLRLAQQVLPQLKRISLIYSDDSIHYYRQAEAACRRLGMSLSAVKLDDPGHIATAVQESLRDNHALLAVPDSRIFNAQTIKPILLSSIHLNKPVIGGFSDSYVNAGILSGVYSTPAAIGRLAAEMLRNRKAELRQDPVRLHSSDFEIAINARVARALGLLVPAHATLHQRMHISEVKSDVE